MIRPLLHFLLIGAALLAVERRVVPLSSPARETITLSANEIERLVREWRAETGRAPDARERSALLDAAIDDELLFRTGLRMGLAATDPVARRRLVQNMRFLGTGSAPDEAELLRRALALGMDRRDLVVRRRLVELVAARLRQEGTAAVDEKDLRHWIAAHPERFPAERQLHLEQAFFSSSLRGPRLDRDARLALARLAASGGAFAEDHLTGDPLPFGDAAVTSEREISRLYGAELARAIAMAPLGRWTGPLRSAYGLHLVRISSIDTVVPASESIRATAQRAIATEREEQALRRGLRRLRENSALQIETAMTAEARR